MGVTFTIRVPNLDDADGAAEVHNRGWRETYARLLPAEFYDGSALFRRQRLWRRLIEQADSSRRLYVGESDGAIVGVALAGSSLGERPARDLELYMLYVISPFHGTGVGQALLDAVVGQEHAQLWVAQDNPRAHAFYRRNGFAPDGAKKVDRELNDLAEVRFVR
jgi:GNAT superfamily N-acetyltransferase